MWELPSHTIRIELFSLLYELIGFIDELMSICHQAKKSGSYYSLSCKMEAVGNSKGWAPDEYHVHHFLYYFFYFLKI